MSTQVSESRISGLPKWAQDYIRHLRQQLTLTERARSSLAGEHNITRMGVQVDYMNDIIHYYPNHTTVRWDFLGPRGGSPIDVRLQHDGLHVMGHNKLIINPVACNVVNITNSDR